MNLKAWKVVVKAALPSLSKVQDGKSVLISAHKHVLRAMVHLHAGISNEQVQNLMIPNA